MYFHLKSCFAPFPLGGDSESGPPLSQNHGKDDLIGLCSGGFGTCEDIQDKAVSSMDTFSLKPRNAFYACAELSFLIEFFSHLFVL